MHFFLQKGFILREGNYKFLFTLFVCTKTKNDTCLSEPGKFICYMNGNMFHTKQYCKARSAFFKVSGVRKRLIMLRNNSSFKFRKILGLENALAFPEMAKSSEISKKLVEFALAF